MCSCNGQIGDRPNKLKSDKVIVVSGTANGADKLGEVWATHRLLEIKRFPANWEKYGRGAGHIRNSEMADYADALICFWDGISKGSENMIQTMTKLGKSVRVVEF